MKKTKTYEDYVNDLRAAYKTSDNAKSERDKLEEELETIACFDKMVERFGKFGKVESNRYGGDYILKADFNGSLIDITLSKAGYGWNSEREWLCDNLNFNNVLKRLNFNGDSIESLNLQIDNAKIKINEIVNESNNGKNRINEVIENIKSLKSKIVDAEHEQADAYEQAKRCFISNKYGKDGIAAPYYLRDKKGNETLGLVNIIKKEDSGLGFTVEDIESGRRYYHVSGLRLREDLRDFPSMYDLGHPNE